MAPRGGGASRYRPLSSPEAGWAEPELRRGFLSTSGSESASPRLSLGSPPLAPPALLRSARSGSTWRAGLPDWPVCGPPGTRLTAVPWRAPARPLSGVCPGRSSAAVRLRRWLSVAPARSLRSVGIFQGSVTSEAPPAPGAVVETLMNWVSHLLRLKGGV